MFGNRANRTYKVLVIGAGFVLLVCIYFAAIQWQDRVVRDDFVALNDEMKAILDSSDQAAGLGAQSPVAGNGVSTAKESALPGKIDLNTASAELLQTLKGIGSVKARAIVDYRESSGPFAAIEDIMNVKGIGPKTFEKLKDFIVISGR